MSTKIYVICLDAFPETPELINLMREKKLCRSELVCGGAFTCATMTSMISGTIGTEIIPGGIGYNTLYSPNFFAWRKNHCIIDRLRDEGLSTIIHNHVPWFSNILAGVQLTDAEKNSHYRDHIISDDGVTVYPFGVIKTNYTTKLVLSSTNPDLTLNTFVKWNFPEEKNKFFANETNYIKHIQSTPFNGLFLTDLCLWHEFVYYPSGHIKSDRQISKEDALVNSIDWVKNWNFDEPNSIFYIFADHSHRVNSYLDPPSYLTWVYFKDNVTNSKLNPIISSNDFYQLVELTFKLDHRPPSTWASNPVNFFNKNRIYAVEDGRAGSVVKTIANAFGRCCLFKQYFLSVVKLTDSTTYPAGIYLMITTLENKHTYTIYRFDDLNLPHVHTNSIKCKNSLDERINTIDIIYKLDTEILAKAKELYKLI